MAHNKQLIYKLYKQKEIGFTHESLDSEDIFCDIVASGDVEKIIELREKYKDIEEIDKGTLSENPLRNKIYHFVINTAVITRSCVRKGLPEETAYTLSDIYIKRADNAKSIQEVKELNDEMPLEFARAMLSVLNPLVSKSVHIAMQYIAKNLEKNLTAESISKMCGYNRSYFSTLFKKEAGVSISDYILIKRIESAKSVLSETNCKILEISNSLGFSSQSHFCKNFKKITGMSPLQYKKYASENK